MHHPVTPKKRVVTKTKTDHLSDELNLGYRQVLKEYKKGFGNAGKIFMGGIDGFLKIMVN